MSGGFEETTGDTTKGKTEDTAEKTGGFIGKLAFVSVLVTGLAIWAGFMFDALDWAFHVGRSIIG